jgi:hypothetical protein
MMPAGAEGMTAARSASACGPWIGLIRTQSRFDVRVRAGTPKPRPRLFSASQHLEVEHDDVRGQAVAFSIFRSLPPGANSRDAH